MNHRVEIINTRTGLDVELPEARNSATFARCPKCRARILIGLDDEIAALPIRVDVDPVDRVGEARALLAGRRTAQLHHRPRPVLRYRDHWQIAGRPADTVVVLAEHVCGQPLGHPIPTPTPTKESPDACPF